MDTSFPATMRASLEVCRQHLPAQHCADCRGDVWALARLGTTRTCRTNVARSRVFVERHLASWERLLAESHWDLRGVSHTLVTRLVPQVGASLYWWDAWLAAVETTVSATVRGPMPGVQTWHDHSGNPARGESWVGHHWARIGWVSAWGAGYVCGPVLARLLPGPLKPLGVVGGADGWQRLDFGWGVVALVRERQQWLGERPLRGVADAYFSQAAFLNPLGAAGMTVIPRWRKDAVGWDAPDPVVGKRPRGRPRTKGRRWKLAKVRQTEPVTHLTMGIYGNEETMPVVWRDVWLRDVTHKGRVVVLATTGEPLLVVSMDVTLPPEVMIPLSAARFPLELRLRDLKQYGGLGDSQCYTVLAIPRFVQLALTAFCLWRLTRLREQPTPWLPAERATPAGALSPRSFQRLHRGLRRLVWPRIVASSAPGPNSQNTAVSDEPLFRIAA
jgi:hypothetical protein